MRHGGIGLILLLVIALVVVWLATTQMNILGGFGKPSSSDSPAGQNALRQARELAEGINAETRQVKEMLENAGT